MPPITNKNREKHVDLAQDSTRKHLPLYCLLLYPIECDVGTDEEDIVVDCFGQIVWLLPPTVVMGVRRVSLVFRYKIYPMTAKHNMKAQLGRPLLGTKILLSRLSFPETLA